MPLCEWANFMRSAREEPDTFHHAVLPDEIGFLAVLLSRDCLAWRWPPPDLKLAGTSDIYLSLLRELGLVLESLRARAED